MEPFIHLHVHTQYSLLDGQASIDALIDKAQKDGMPAIAVTDHGVMFGIKEFFNKVSKKNGKPLGAIKDYEKELKELKSKTELTAEEQARLEEIPAKIEEEKKKIFKPIFGCECYCARNGRHSKLASQNDRSGWHLIVLAKNLNGYKNLIKMVSLSWTEGFYGRPRIDKELLEKYHEDLIICSACIGGEIPQHILNGRMDKAEESVLWFKNLFGEDYYLEIQRHETHDPNAAQDVYPHQVTANKAILELARKHNIKVIATNDVHFVNAEDAEAHDRLICLSTGKDLDDPNRMRYTKQEWMKTTAEMNTIFSDIPEALSNTLEIADKVEFYSIDHGPIMPTFAIPEDFGTEEGYRQKFTEQDLFDEFTRDENGNVVLSEEAAHDKIKKLGGYEKLYRIKLEADYLKKITYDGAKICYGDDLNDEVKERLNFELHIMKTMGFPGYFLIVQDFIRAAREELGVSVGPGRGSAAGSAVAYCLGITRIDPIKYDLLFERFLNPDRISLPDIDTDFDDDGRGEVLRWVTEKYGAERVAHIITYGTMATKSAIKDVARVQKLPLAESNRLAKLVPDKIPDMKKFKLKDAINYVPELKEAATGNDPLARDTLKYAQMLEGNVRNTGVHACGVIIGRYDISDVVPVSTAKDKDTGEEMLVTQYEGSVIEETGLIKMDFLGLKTLSIIKEAIENIRLTTGHDLDIDHISLEDPATYKLYCDGKTTGTFQFESAGMQKYLKELQPSKFEDLIAMNALYRPGPMEYIPSFIRRKHGEEPIEYDHPMMEPYLKDTYGITVYQEQVMLQSRALGLFTRGQSDTLRKAMGKKKFELLAELKGKFVEGCKNNPDFVQGAKEKGKNVEELVNKIWGDWEAFASYAFNKSHSVCYAYIAYQTGFLKAHYPAEFMAANLSNNLSDITKVTVFMDECKRMGLSVLAPDVNESYNDFTVNSHGQIRFGMAAIKGVGEAAVEKIIEEREKNGPYKDVYDFFERIDYKSVNKKTIENLVTAGGLDSFGYHRAQYLHLVDATTTVLDNLVNYGQKNQQDSMNLQATLFGELDGFEVTKPNIPDCEPWHDYEKSKKEKELIGIYLTSHPLDPYKLEMQLLCTPVEELNSGLETFKGKEINIAGIITAKREGKTKTGKDFGILTLEDFSGTYELAFFGKDYTDFRQYFIDETAIYVKGKVGPKWGKEGNELTFTIQKVGLLEALTENAIRSITLQVDIEKLTLETVTEIHELFTTDVNSESYKEAQQKAAEQKTQKNSDPENFEEPATVQNDIPLNFMLFDRQGNSVKMFSRTCKIRRSRELYEYFENNDSIKMKIN